MILPALLATTLAFAQADEPEFAEMVVMLDVSGSTSDTQKALRGCAIERAKNQLDYYGEGRFRLAMVTYSFGVAQASAPSFTSDPVKMASYLAAPIRWLGGKEEATDVAMKALTKLDWSYGKKVKRMLLVLGNEPPQQGLTKMQDVVDVATKGKVSISTCFTPFSIDAGSPDPWAQWASMGNGDFRLLSESDVIAYTGVYDQFHRDLLLAEDAKQKSKYLNDLMNKRSRRSGGN